MNEKNPRVGRGGGDTWVEETSMQTELLYNSSILLLRKDSYFIFICYNYIILFIHGFVVLSSKKGYRLEVYDSDLFRSLNRSTVGNTAH